MRMTTMRISSTSVTGKANIPGHYQTLLHELERSLSRVRTSMTHKETIPDWNEYLLLAQNMLQSIHKTRLIDQKPFSSSSTTRSNLQVNERKSVYIDASEIFDETVRIICDRALSHPNAGRRGNNNDNDSWDGVQTALALLDLQTSPDGRNILSHPYSSVARKTWLQALHTVNILMKRGKTSGAEAIIKQGDATFSILERLCTYDGVRNSITSRGSSASSVHPIRLHIDERDFNHALNNFCNTGRMVMAEQVIALQDSTVHAPPLSAVSFSIVLKGYGRIQDLKNVRAVWTYLQSKVVDMDIVLHNSLIDAYVNCGDVERAHHAFLEVTHHKDGLEELNHPLPNVRTYNTMLKGFARTGDVEKATELMQTMNQDMIDDITTNTLVNVLVSGREFDMAQSVLENFTTAPVDVDHTKPHAGRGRRKSHPNVEAYTALLNGYGKVGMFKNALSTLKIMRERGVAPNEYTYSCMINALARAQKPAQAHKMLKFMESHDNITPSVITYNAFLSGILEESADNNYEEDVYMAVADLTFNGRVNVAMDVVNKMIKAEIKPNAITVTTMVEAFGRCNPPRLIEAKTITDKLDNLGYVPKDGLRVSTAMIQACGLSNDYESAHEAFKRIVKPDVIAYNAYLDACCRCGKVKIALTTLKTTNAKSESTEESIIPNVATYNVLLSALLDTGNVAASQHARQLYRGMNQLWGIQPDKGLVDTILNAMISGGNSLGLNEKDVQFTFEVLRDAKELKLYPEGFDKLEKDIKAVIVGRMSEVWKEDIFEQKNWNRIDSGFRFWGSIGSESNDNTSTDSDDFLDSKNWNSMNSGFRLF